MNPKILILGLDPYELPEKQVETDQIVQREAQVLRTHGLRPVLGMIRLDGTVVPDFASIIQSDYDYIVIGRGIHTLQLPGIDDAFNTVINQIRVTMPNAVLYFHPTLENMGNEILRDLSRRSHWNPTPKL
jgi:hypothetical protein